MPLAFFGTFFRFERKYYPPRGGSPITRAVVGASDPVGRRPAPEEKKRASQKPAVVPESVTPPRGEERPGVQIKGYNTAYKGLYLRVPNAEDPLCKKAMQYIEIFDGVTDLYLYYTDTKKLVRAPARYRVAVNYELVSALKKLLGEGNVALKE